MIRRDPAGAAASRYDLIVIGGGIQGVMTALEAARRGLRPLLLERGDFGGGTTWNSLGIVHGGLRYLQTLDLHRHRESAAEQTWLSVQFPDLVEPLPCLMPLYGRGLRRVPVFRLALMLDRQLRRRSLRCGERSSADQSRILNAAQTKSLFAAVDTRSLRGAALWHDAVLNQSERLVIEALRWACRAGAICLNYLEAEELLREGDCAVGVAASDRLGGGRFQFSAPVVVNCAGPRCRDVAATFDRDIPELFHPSLAFNLLLDREPPSATAVAVAPPPPRARTYFLRPWHGRTLAGTYHAAWHGPADSPRPPDRLVASFLQDLERAIPGLELNARHIVRIYGGLVPAISKGTDRTMTRPIIHDHGRAGGPHGLFSVSGVKLTTARRVAERVLTAIYSSSLPAAGQIGRPAAPDRLDWTQFSALAERDAGLAAAHLRRFVDEEAAIGLDDLLLRRTDWGVDPRHCDDATRLIGRLLGAAPGTRFNSEREMTQWIETTRH